MHRGVVFSEGTSEENQAAANALDALVFPILCPDPDPITYCYEEAIENPSTPGEWAYPVDDDSEPLIVAAGKLVVNLEPLGYFPPPVFP